MKQTIRYMSWLMAIMLLLMGNGTTLAHCQHTGQMWLYSFIDDNCETDSDCCDDEQESEDECVETINLDLASTAVSDASHNIFQIPVFSLLPSVQPEMPVFSESLANRNIKGLYFICGPPRSVLYKHCILRI